MLQKEIPDLYKEMQIFAKTKGALKRRDPNDDYVTSDEEEPRESKIRRVQYLMDRTITRKGEEMKEKHEQRSHEEEQKENNEAKKMLAKLKIPTNVHLNLTEKWQKSSNKWNFSKMSFHFIEWLIRAKK